MFVRVEEVVKKYMGGFKKFPQPISRRPADRSVACYRFTNGCPAFCNDAPKLKADSLTVREADVACGESAGEFKQRGGD